MKMYGDKVKKEGVIRL